MASPRKNNESRSRKRIKLVGILLLIATGGLIFKLFKIQVLSHESLTEQSERQYTRTVYSQPRRGIVYDRSFKEIAADIEVDSIYANPLDIEKPAETSKILADALGLTQDSVDKKLKTKKGFVWLKRRVSLERSKNLIEKDINGIGAIKEYKRFYPKRELASRLIGFSGTDNDGLAGIEYSYNRYLRGGGTRIILEKDAKGRNMRFIGKTPNELDRCDIVLTIDEVIQYIAEKELKKKILETGAKDGVAIVMEPNTGEILAMADYPPFNPNNFRQYSPENWRNKALSNAYEPGSTFKIFLAAAAIESGIKPNSMFFCENGAYKIGKVTIHEASKKKFEWLSLVDIIGKSSNIGAIKIGQRLNKRRFKDFITGFGFGVKTGIDLDGESLGLVRDLNQWTPLSLCSISLGQEISVTPIQLITALSAIANGGILLKPRVVREIHRNGRPVKKFQPEIVRRVISKETSRIMTAILKKVVEKGTGKMAWLDGHSIVGKTGTAQKFDEKVNAYSDTKYLASFAGYFPAEDPRLAILVMVDEPKSTFWGGRVAAPVFREIARQAARYLKIPSKTGKVIWVKRTYPELEKKVSEDNFEKGNEYFKSKEQLFARISRAIKQFKDSPRFYNDLQYQKKL